MRVRQSRSLLILAYLTDALKTLDETTSITAELIDSNNAAVFKTNDCYAYVVMPLTREQG